MSKEIITRPNLFVTYLTVSVWEYELTSIREERLFCEATMNHTKTVHVVYRHRHES